jgi:hypothetical protein
MDAMLRFYDPRILQQLSKILSSKQASRFFCLGEKWWYVSRTGELAEVASEFSVGHDADSPLSLSQDQEVALLDALEPDRILYLLLESAPQLESRLPPDRYKFVAGELLAALDFGITSTADVTLYCIVVLLCGVNFKTQPYWGEALLEVRMRRLTFAQVVASSPDIEL